MKIPLAWHNTFQNKKRTLAAIGGISFSLLLIFMQLGFLTTARITAGLVYDYFDYDLIITSAAYETIKTVKPPTPQKTYIHFYKSIILIYKERKSRVQKS